MKSRMHSQLLGIRADRRYLQIKSALPILVAWTRPPLGQAAGPDQPGGHYGKIVGRLHPTDSRW